MIDVGRGPATVVVLACALAMLALMMSVRADRPDWTDKITAASVGWLVVTIVILAVGLFAALLVPA